MAKKRGKYNKKTPAKYPDKCEPFRVKGQMKGVIESLQVKLNLSYSDVMRELIKTSALYTSEVSQQIIENE